VSAFTVVVDACVLFPAPIRDLVVRLAITGIFSAKWTDEIHDEWIRNLLKIREDITPESLNRCRQLMNKAVPDCLVEHYQDLIPALKLPDEDDRHVLAAAIRSKANAIVTFNLKDFPESELAKYDIEAIDPDDFLLLQIGLSDSTVCSAAKTARAALKSPSLTVSEYLQNLSKCGLAQTAASLRKYADLL
jgi:predicted nucleic acid-binding protein